MNRRIITAGLASLVIAGILVLMNVMAIASIDQAYKEVNGTNIHILEDFIQSQYNIASLSYLGVIMFGILGGVVLGIGVFFSPNKTVPQSNSDNKTKEEQ